MDSYTITITPNDESGNTTTLVVDTTGDQIRITDMHVHATAGLIGGEMPSVDFGFLLRAVAGPAGSPVAVTSGRRASVASHDRAGDEPVATSVRAEAAAAAPPTVVADPSHDADEDPSSVAAPASAKRRSGARRTARKAATARKKATAGGTDRVYRRMPEDFADVYRQASTSAAIVDHYDVPRHTAQGWIRRFKASADA